MSRGLTRYIGCGVLLGVETEDDPLAARGAVVVQANVILLVAGSVPHLVPGLVTVIVAAITVVVVYEGNLGPVHDLGRLGDRLVGVGTRTDGTRPARCEGDSSIERFALRILQTSVNVDVALGTAFGAQSLTVPLVGRTAV